MVVCGVVVVVTVVGEFSVLAWRASVEFINPIYFAAPQTSEGHSRVSGPKLALSGLQVYADGSLFNSNYTQSNHKHGRARFLSSLNSRYSMRRSDSFSDLASWVWQAKC